MTYSVTALRRLPDPDHDHFPAFNPMSPRAKMLLLACACLALLMGCGQRGPLYLPDETTEETTAESTTEATIETGTTQTRENDDTER